jgi:hypothetical protein
MKHFFENKEENNELFSVLNVSSSFELDTFMNRKNLIMIKSKSNYIDSSINYEECLFQTSAGFYLYLEKLLSTDFYKLSFYYKEEQLNEVKIFLNQLIKNKK